MDRRTFIAGLAGPAALANSSLTLASGQFGQTTSAAPTGRLVHGVTRNTFGPDPNLNFDEACRQVAPLGIKGFDFATPAEFPILKKYGMICSLYRAGGAGGAAAAPPSAGAPPAPAPGAGRGRGGPASPATSIGSVESMGDYRQAILEGIDVAAANGIPNVFLSAGSRRPDLNYGQGADNAVAFCNAVKGRAEEKGVTLVIEYLNSKGYAAPAMSMFDNMAWGVDVCQRVNSPRVKILYDIYHVQIMEGFIVQRLRDNIQYIAHIHTGGVPGRHELDDTQELNWRFIARAIADLNYKGFVTHEWTPTPGRHYLDGLKQALDIMNV